MGFKLARILRRFLSPGGKGNVEQEAGKAVDYNGYTIRPASYQEGAHWITAWVISKSFADGVKENQFVRADMSPGKDGADAIAVSKAKRIIDELGDGLFESY